MNERFISERVDVVINEMARNSLGEEPELFNVINESFRDLDDLREFLVDRYGRIPGGRNKVYIDIHGCAREIGFTHSYWTRDESHSGCKSWYQTDWIMISGVTDSSVQVVRADL